MASMQFSGSGVAAVKRSLPSFDGLRLSPSTFRASSSVGACGLGLDRRCFRGLVVKAATVVAPKVDSGLKWADPIHLQPLNVVAMLELLAAEDTEQSGAQSI